MEKDLASRDHAPDAGVALEGTWQPIETAPKDGTVVDIWVNGERVPNVRWGFSVDVATGERLYDPVWDGWEHTDRPWQGMGGGYPPMVKDGNAATHWRLPPEPPSSAKPADGDKSRDAI